MILTFSIPTFRRRDPLFRLCDSLFNAIAQADPSWQFEIVINSNGPFGYDLPVVPDAIGSRCVIKASENSYNMGIDANFLVTLGRSSGEYVWLLGDDDEVLAPQFLQTLDLVRETSPCVLTLANKWAAKYERVGNSYDYFYKSGFTPVFMSNNIFHGPSLRTVINSGDMGKFVGTQIIHCFLIAKLVSLAKDRPGILARTAAIRQHVSKNEDFQPSLPALLLGCNVFAGYAFGRGFSALKARRKFFAIDAWSYCKSILNDKIDGSFDSRIIPLLLLNYWVKLRFWLMILPVACVPGIIVKPIIGRIKRSGAKSG